MANPKAVKALTEFLRPISDANQVSLADLEPFIAAIVQGLRDGGLSEVEIVETFGDPIEGA